MIKKIFFTFFVLILVAFSDGRLYKDGIYSGMSRAVYLDEPYYGVSKIAIENGKIVEVHFSVRDSSKGILFDEKYERFFAGNDEYINQCRNDWKGINAYPDSFLKYQDLKKVDVISGATWSHNLFVSSTQEALSAAEKEKYQ